MSRLTALWLALATLPAWSGEADVLDVKVLPGSNGWNFQVSVRHDDQGWGHYADAWEILTPDGRLVARRVLYHPHVEEQPFTRSLSHVQVPKGVEAVVIRAHDKVHGYGGKTVTLPWPPAQH